MAIKSTHWSENRLLYLGGFCFYFTTGRASATDCERYKKYLSSPPLNEKYFFIFGVVVQHFGQPCCF